jgi:hypothetical protein
MLQCAHVVPSGGAAGCLNRSGKRDVREDSPTRVRGTAMRQGRNVTRTTRRHRDRQGNFPPCKALKTHEMRKEFRFCASPFPRAGGPACADARPGAPPAPGDCQRHRARGSNRPGERCKSPSRSEMAPQRLEKIESALGNGMGSDASNLQDLVERLPADPEG